MTYLPQSVFAPIFIATRTTILEAENEGEEAFDRGYFDRVARDRVRRRKHRLWSTASQTKLVKGTAKEALREPLLLCVDPKGAANPPTECRNPAATPTVSQSHAFLGSGFPIAS